MNVQTQLAAADEKIAAKFPVLKSDDIKKAAYKEWPLFTDLRKEQKFIDTYEKIFNEKYEIIGEKEL